ncbi:MAG: hypothetical protein ACREDK_03665 [Thermoplasmata archaeon]
MPPEASTLPIAAPELVRVATLLEFGIDAAGCIASARWSDPADLPRLCVVRHANGYTVYPARGLPEDVGRRIARSPPGDLFEGQGLDAVFGGRSPNGIVTLVHSFFPGGDAPEGPPGVTRHGGHFVDMVEGRPVSWAWTVREHARAASVAVETVAGFRRQGRGSRVLRSWVADVYRRGKLPLESHAAEDAGVEALVVGVGAIAYARSVRYR